MIVPPSDDWRDWLLGGLQGLIVFAAYVCVLLLLYVVAAWII